MSGVRGARCAPLFVRVAIVTTRTYPYTSLPSEFRLAFIFFHCTELCWFSPLRRRCRSSLRRLFCFCSALVSALCSAFGSALHSPLFCILHSALLSSLLISAFRSSSETPTHCSEGLNHLLATVTKMQRICRVHIAHVMHIAFPTKETITCSDIASFTWECPWLYEIHVLFADE